MLAEKRAPLDPRPSVMSLATVETISKDDIITDIPSLSLSSQQPQPGQALDETKAAEWTRLFLEKISANSRDVITIDPSLSNLFSCSDVAWDQVMDHLKNIFNSTCRELCDVIAVDTNGKSKKQRRRHLMIFNAENHDYLIHMIVCDFPAVGGLSGFCRNNVLAAASVVENKENVSSASPKNMSVEIRAVSREGVSDEVEYSHINNVIQHVMMFILEINVNGDN